MKLPLLPLLLDRAESLPVGRAAHRAGSAGTSARSRPASGFAAALKDAVGPKDAAPAPELARNEPEAPAGTASQAEPPRRARRAADDDLAAATGAAAATAAAAAAALARPAVQAGEGPRAAPAGSRTSAPGDAPVPDRLGSGQAHPTALAGPAAPPPCASGAVATAASFDRDDGPPGPAARSADPSPAAQLGAGSPEARPISDAPPPAPVTPAAPLPPPDAPPETVSGNIGAHAAHLRLDSPQLGELALHVRVRDGVAFVRVEGEAGALLQAQAPELSRALAAEGITLAGVEAVDPPPAPIAPASEADRGAGADLHGGDQRERARERPEADDLPTARRAAPRTARTSRGGHHVEA